MHAALTESDLVHGLHQLGVLQGMALEVHCSFSKFGYVEGGTDTLIHALMQAVGSDGAIVMPSFRLSPNLSLTDDDRQLGLTTKIRLLAEDEEHTAMGVVSDAFRNRPGVKTGEGIFRVSAWGKDADKHSAGFHHLIDNDGRALLLGVDIYRLSAMHYVEDAMPDEIRNKFKPSPEARAKYPEDQWLVESWVPDAKPWYKIQDEAYSKGLIKDAYIGKAKCMLLKVQPVINLYRQALSERPLELYGLT